jgi:hypothetical protein
MFMMNLAFRARRTCIMGLALLIISVGSPAGAANLPRPYGGSCDAAVTVLTPPGVFPQELSIDLACKLKHLGNTTGLILQTVTPTAMSGSTVFANIENVTTYAAANGDMLESTQVGTATIDLVTGAVHFTLAETFTAGTGRFAEVSGSSDVEGDASIFTNLGFFTISGAIGY